MKQPAIAPLNELKTLYASLAPRVCLILLVPFFTVTQSPQRSEAEERSAKLSPRRAQGPLRVHSTNPHYFTDGSGRAIYLTGPVFHGLHQPIFDSIDYPSYLNLLQSNRHNV